MSSYYRTPPQNGDLDDVMHRPSSAIKRDYSSPRLHSMANNAYSHSTQFSRSRKIFDKGPVVSVKILKKKICLFEYK